MSFFLGGGGKNDRGPGVVGGNASNGISERILISVKKVFDAGIRQTSREGCFLALSDFSKPAPKTPFVFVAAQNADTRGELSGLTIERFPDRPRQARIKCDIKIPILVSFNDADNDLCTGKSEIVIPQDVILSVPEPSIIPYAFEAIVSAAAPRGSYVQQNSFMLDLCITTVLKIVIDADILVPSYGYAQFPPIQDFVDNSCNGYFDLPLYPDSNKRR